MNDYEWLTQMGLCHKCRKEKTAPNRKRCFDCLDKMREYKRRYARQCNKTEHARKQRELYEKHKKEGICVRCRKPATHGLHCYEHSIRVKRHSQNTAERKKRERHERGLIPAQRKENHLCLWCGDVAVEGLQCCKKHQKLFSDAGKKITQNENHPWVKEERARWKMRQKSLVE